MAEPQGGSAVAKELNIALARIYGYIRSGKVKNYKKDGFPIGKGIEVDIDEVRAAMTSGRTKTPRAPREKKSAKAVVGSEGQSVSGTRRLKTGTLVSYDKGQNGSSRSPHGPRYTIAQVVGSSGRLTYLDEGDHRRHYDGTMINNLFFGTERMATLLAKGAARVERPLSVLGMLVFAFVSEGKIELAGSLEDWCEANGLEILVPEPIDLEPEPEDAEVAQPVGGILEPDDEDLAGEE